MEDASPLIPSVIDVKKKKAEKQKFVVGVGEPRPPPPEGITNSAVLRRPHRHHVKRRTAGRMHRVAKAHLTDSEAECGQATVTPVAMRRSQSQRSLQQRRWSSQPLQTSDEQRQSNSNSSSSSINSRSTPTLFVLQQQTAAPVEQTFNALANNLVAPNGAAYPAAVHAAAASPVLSPFSSPHPARKPTLRSQFVSAQGTLHEDEKPYVARELDRMEREYDCLKQYRDPMVESLVRCMLVRKSIRRSQPVNRTMSTSAVATAKTLHSGHRQAAAAVRRQHQENISTVRRRNSYNNTSLSSNQASPIASPRGMLSALWERMVQGMST